MNNTFNVITALLIILILQSCANNSQELVVNPNEAKAPAVETSSSTTNAQKEVPKKETPSEIGDGIWVVGTDIKLGTYEVFRMH